MKRIRIHILLPLLFISYFSSAQKLVKDINSGGQSAYPDELVDVNGTLFFSAYTDNEGYELWKSDGTSMGTELVKDIVPGVFSSGPQFLTNVNGTLFFSAYTANGENELWKSDGTSAGTVIVKDINPQTGNYGGADPRNLINFNGELIFAANNGTTDGASELWKSDGTNAGTVMIKNINPQGGSYANDFMIINGKLFFIANDGNGSELWITDGTSAGTYMVKDICNTTNRPMAARKYFTNVNNTLFFVPIDNSYYATGSELWKSDGTNAGTVFVKNIRIGEGGGTVYMASCNGELYFNATDGTNGVELWKSDGSSAGTLMVKDINTTSVNSYPREMINYKNEIYFSANNGTQGIELWKSNGTSSGTMMVKDIYTGVGSSDPSLFLVFNGTLFFKAQDGSSYNTWKTNGTSNATIQHPNFDLAYGLENVHGQHKSPAYSIVSNSTLFFSSINGGFGSELWKYDGTMAGINEANTDASINIYPNPSNGVFQLKMENMQSSKSALEIYSLLGEKVLALSNIKTQMSIDISSLSKGIYLVKLYDGSKIYNQKISIQ